MYKQILLTHLKLKVEELAKKHVVDKDKVKITYEDYQLFYYIERGTEVEKRFLDI
jgi:hypothetical protein